MTTRAFNHLSRAWPGLARNGVLTGTTKIAGTPDVPTRSLVQLFQSDPVYGYVFPNAVMIDWQWSDAAGNYQFANLDPAKKYHVIGYDATGTYDPVVKINLTPTPA